MKFLREKETLSQNMAFMALMAAINIVFSVVIALVPFLSVFLIIFLPLTTTIVVLTCKSKYFPIYAFATLGLSLVATLWNMETTLFYVFPSLLTGLVFGLLTKWKIHPVWSIFIGAIFQSGLTSAFIPILNFIFDTDIINFFMVAFKVDGEPWGNVVILVFIFVISLIQVFLSYFVAREEIKKFGFNENKQIKHFWIYPLICLATSLSLIGFYFLSLSVAYLFFAISIYFASFLVIRLIEQKYYGSLILCGVSLLTNIFVVALLAKYLKQFSQVLLFGFTPLCISIISLLIYFLKKQKEKIE